MVQSGSEEERVLYVHANGGWNGRHSLLLYWVHVELVYGRLFGGLKGRQSIATVSWWLLAITAAMLALSFLPDLMKRRQVSTV
ncbi:MAG: hypothetical protein HYX75_10805 [Acidobacteria bacterium]|nr:hypothetical protein [Acidobacteriota bacterium]